jgi:hypothetical protein
VNAVDALKVLRYSAGLTYVEVNECVNIGQALGNGVLQGDVDCSGLVSAVDALKLLRSAAGLGYTRPDTCPAIGS